jgi:hypothetical protein
MKKLNICMECGSTNIGQMAVLDTNSDDTDGIDLIELWSLFFCYDCEKDVEAEQVTVQ